MRTPRNRSPHEANVALIGIAISSAIAIGAAHAQTANTLISEGNAAYKADKCVTAAARYYALQVRYPSWLDSDLKKNLNARIAWCERNSSVNARGKTDAKGEAKPDSGDLSTALQRNDRCALYAEIAIAQYRVNQLDQCGFSGNRWTDNFAHHYNWCTTAGTSELDAENVARQQGLIACHGN